MKKFITLFLFFVSMSLYSMATSEKIYEGTIYKIKDEYILLLGPRGETIWRFEITDVEDLKLGEEVFIIETQDGVEILKREEE